MLTGGRMNKIVRNLGFAALFPLAALASRGLGHRRDDRPADQVRQGRGDRRQGPLPDSGTAGSELHRLGAGLWARRLSQDKNDRGQDGEPEGDRRALREGSGRVLPRHVLVLHAEHSREGPVPGHGRQRQRHLAEHQDPGAVGRHGEERLSIVPCARLTRHPRGAEAVHRERAQLGRGLGAPNAVGPGDEQHGARPGLHGHRRRAEELRRLDRSHRRRRGAVRQAEAARRRRAQRRRHHVGFLYAEALPARRRRELSAQPAAECQRTDLRRAGGEHGQRPGARSGEAPRLYHQPSGFECRDAFVQAAADAAVGLLGRGADLGRLEQHPQRDDGRGRTDLVLRAASAAGESGVLQEGLGSPVRQGRATGKLAAPGLGVRPEDAEVAARRPVLLDPPPLLRQGQRHALVQPGRSRERRDRLAQDQAVPRQRRRGEVAGLDADHRRHQRQRQT